MSDSSLVRPFPALTPAAQLTKRINSISALEKEQAQLLEEMEAESAKLKATLAARETTINKVRRTSMWAVQNSAHREAAAVEGIRGERGRCRGVVG